MAFSKQGLGHHTISTKSYLLGSSSHSKHSYRINQSEAFLFLGLVILHVTVGPANMINANSNANLQHE
jgi:hypothetical protein